MTVLQSVKVGQEGGHQLEAKAFDHSVISYLSVDFLNDGERLFCWNLNRRPASFLRALDLALSSRLSGRHPFSSYQGTSGYVEVVLGRTEQVLLHFGTVFNVQRDFEVILTMDEMDKLACFLHDNWRPVDKMLAG